MRTILKILTISLVFVCSIGQNCGTYDVIRTHQYINSRALEESKAGSILENSLGFPGGINYKINGLTIQEWTADGGKKEAEPSWRCLRHFHDPLKNWNGAGFKSLYRSSIFWAQTPEAGNSYSLYNEYSWPLAKEYYYQALLTGSGEYWAKTFRALGQVMHLVSDAAVHAHERNDNHLSASLLPISRGRPTPTA